MFSRAQNGPLPTASINGELFLTAELRFEILWMNLSGSSCTRMYLIAAVQSFLPQLQLQHTGGGVEVAADDCGLQLLLHLLLFLQLIPAQLQVPVREEQEEEKKSWIFLPGD